MDAREGNSQNKYGMCGQKGHNRKTCQNKKIYVNWFKFNKMLCNFLLYLIMYLMISVLFF